MAERAEATRQKGAAAVIAILSQVVHGHVGNSAALFPLQACGIEVAAVPTTLLPRYPTLRGQVLDVRLVRDLLLGVEGRGLVDARRVLISGYLGSAENAAVVTDFVVGGKRATRGFSISAIR